MRAKYLCQCISQMSYNFAPLFQNWLFLIWILFFVNIDWRNSNILFSLRSVSLALRRKCSLLSRLISICNKSPPFLLKWIHRFTLQRVSQVMKESIVIFPFIFRHFINSAPGWYVVEGYITADTNIL